MLRSICSTNFRNADCSTFSTAATVDVIVQYRNLLTANEVSYHYLQNQLVPRDGFELCADDTGKCPIRSLPSIEPGHLYIPVFDQYQERVKMIEDMR